jgi:hypothetical protein
MRSYRVAVALVFLVCGPVLLPAQGFSFSGAGLYAALNGSDFEGINAGLGGDLQFRYQATRGVSIGGGFQYTSHGIEGFSENFGVRAFFVDGRYAFEQAAASSVTPYLGVRVALAHYGVSSGGNELAANGTAFGPIGGLLVRLTPTAQLDIGMAWFAVHFGNAEINGSQQPDSKSSGSALALRAGVVFGFGKK